MSHLEGTTVGELRRALDDVEGKVPTQRLMVAIAYKNGITQTELAGWYGVERKTIYNWLTRLDDAPIEEAAADAKRSGRNRKLSSSQLEEFQRTVNEPPLEAGYDAIWWTTELARRHLAETYGVKYSVSSCRRLLGEAGLSYRKRLQSTAGSGDDDRAEGDDGSDRRGGWTAQ